MATEFDFKAEKYSRIVFAVKIDSFLVARTKSFAVKIDSNTDKVICG